jgi:uncharacterized protein YciI
MQRSLWLASFVLIAGAVSPAARSQTPAPPGKTTYLVVYKPGPAFLAGRPLSQQPLKEHGRYMLGLYTNGTMRFAGGFLDDTGGAFVFEAASEEEAAGVVAADPAVIAKVFVAERYPWRLVDWEERAKRQR